MRRVKQLVGYWCQDIVKNRYIGKHIGIAVLDTGVVKHPDLNGRIVLFKDFLEGRRDPYDDCGHGTHVCGILAGSGRMSNGVYAGMAPECDLIALKVLDKSGNGEMKDVLKGIEWILENKDQYHIRIVNISIGTLPNREDSMEKRLLRAVERLWDAGLIVVTAAGNYGPGKGSVTVPGSSRKVITVGASDDEEPLYPQKNTRKNYSGRGPTQECICKPDLSAPGSGIFSCNAEYRKTQKAYVRKSGTSMATPVVSGAVACFLSKYPDASNVEVKLKLRDSCEEIAGDHKQHGWGMLHVGKLMQYEKF